MIVSAESVGLVEQAAPGQLIDSAEQDCLVSPDFAPVSEVAFDIRAMPVLLVVVS